jgi:hypothetical protein
MSMIMSFALTRLLSNTNHEVTSQSDDFRKLMTRIQSNPLATFAPLGVGWLSATFVVKYETSLERITKLKIREA